LSLAARADSTQEPRRWGGGYRFFVVEANSVDGRILRGQRTRQAVVEAFLSLIEDGDPQPTARMIATRAGVSLRSVFQHFSDLEGLYLVAGRRELAKLESSFFPVDPTIPLGERIVLFVDQRARALEAMAPVARAARLREPFSAQLQKNRDNLKRCFRRCCEQSFAPELAKLTAAQADNVLQAMVAAGSFSAWYSLREEQRLSPQKARTVLRLLFTGVLACAAEPV
jgi:TetR/AcrR family transcriptional regulator of autoinduction and epiphytic fitness